MIKPVVPYRVGNTLYHPSGRPMTKEEEEAWLRKIAPPPPPDTDGIINYGPEKSERMLWIKLATAFGLLTAVLATCTS